MKRYQRHTAEQVQWVRDNCRGLFQMEAWQLFCAHFQTDITLMQFKGILYNNKIRLETRGESRVLPVGTVSGKKIKITNDRGKCKENWQTVNKFLHLKDLKAAYKERLKKVDKKLYNKRFGIGGYGQVGFGNSQLVEKLTGNIV